MYSILIGLAIAIATCIFTVRHDFKRELTFGLSAVACALILTASIVVPTLLGDPDIRYIPTTTERTETLTDIVALKDNTLTEGSVRGAIFIMSGYINEEPVYFFYRRAGTGFVQDFIKAKGVIIYEDAEPDVGYILTTYTVEKVDPGWKKKYLHWLVFNDIQSRGTITEIHVPEGTIIQEFVLDAE